MEGATSQLAGPDSGQMGGYHRPVCVETVVRPLHHSSVEGWGRQQQLQKNGLYSPQLFSVYTPMINQPTYVEDLYLLAGIAPPDIKIYVCARMEQTKQMEQETHSLFGHIPA